jgi:hypothetical protein
VTLDKNGIEVVGTVAGEDCIMDNYSNVLLDSSQIYYVNHDYSAIQEDELSMSYTSTLI